MLDEIIKVANLLIRLGDQHGVSLGGSTVSQPVSVPHASGDALRVTPLREVAPWATNPTTTNSPDELSQISALALVDELLRRGYSIDSLCREVGVSTLDELLSRLQPNQAVRLIQACPGSTICCLDQRVVH